MVKGKVNTHLISKRCHLILFSFSLNMFDDELMTEYVYSSQSPLSHHSNRSLWVCLVIGKQEGLDRIERDKTQIGFSSRFNATTSTTSTVTEGQGRRV